MACSISRDIYSSIDRVVLELIQNADDAKYSYAEDEKCTPYLKFILFPGKVILEYNEDGFTIDDVNRICDISQSNKGEDEIGEKGIGFKSVFMIASKVHIESKEYSFSFRVCEGGNNMQMFTPEYEASDNPPDGYTRITLTLLEEQCVRAEALQKFRKLPTTPLLFLRHIKKLSIVEPGAQSPVITTTYEEFHQRGVLTRDGHSEPDVKHFHIFRQVFAEIPTEGKKRKNTNAEVKLAFPFTPDHKPLIEKQPDVFARLPINSAGVGLPVSLLFHFQIRCSYSPSFWSIPISPPRLIGRLWMRNQRGTLSSLAKLLSSSKLQ
jgi:anti-sigma regulatory factor (Ser/Thr protein kinase)